MLFPELPSASAGMDIPAYERRAPGLADLLDYDRLHSDRIIVHKAGGLIAAFDFRGPSHDATEASELDAAEDQWLLALADLGTGWVVHLDLHRHRASAYPCQCTATDDAACRVESVRRDTFLEHPHFAATSTIWLTFLPTALRSRIAALEQERATFESALDAFASRLRAVSTLRRLPGGELAASLHSSLRLRPPTPLVMHQDAFLDAVLAPSLERLRSGVLRIGDQYAAALRITALPKRLFSGALQALATARLPLRLSTRLILLSSWHADQAIDSIRRRRETTQFSWRSLLGSIVDGKQQAHQREEQDRADGLAPDARWQRERLVETNQALEASYADERFAYFATSLLVIGDSEAEARRHADQVLAMLRAGRLNADRDRFNEVQSYLGATPGNAWANVRRHLQPVRVALAMHPLTSTWAGADEAPHRLLRGHGPLATVRSTSGEAFFLNLHPEGPALNDLGHTLVVGPSGTGKSVLLNFLAASARRYPGARIFGFDVDRSQYVQCRAAGGAVYDIREEGQCFAPLFLLRQHTQQARARTLDWLMTLWDVTHDEPLPDDDAEHLGDALQEIVQLEPDLHTLEVLATKVQSSRLRAMLARYTGDGEHAAVFSSGGAFEPAHYTLFELRGLLAMRKEARIPALAHLLLLVENALDGRRPAWILIDEGSHLLADPILRSALNDWLVTLRKKNASVVFATQSLSHFTDPALRQLFSESCPTRIYLPNAAAASSRDVQSAYEAVGLSPRQVDRIATAIPKEHYLLLQPGGEQLIDLALTPTELAILGVSTPPDIERVDQLRHQHPDDWLERWIHQRITREEASQ